MARSILFTLLVVASTRLEAAGGFAKTLLMRTGAALGNSS